jgi:hypothetical protein
MSVLDINHGSPKVELIDPNWTLKGPEDQMYFQYDQDINDDFLGKLSDTRLASANSRTSDMTLAAEIPVVVVEKWLREGFDIYKENWKAVRKRLIDEDLGYFIATSKSL